MLNYLLFVILEVFFFNNEFILLKGFLLIIFYLEGDYGGEDIKKYVMV